jgi:IstB-like ATP binding protein
LQGYLVLYRGAHTLLEDLADATMGGQRKEHMEMHSTVPLLIIDYLGMRKLPLTAAAELLEIIMRRYERASTLLTSNRPAPLLPPCSTAAASRPCSQSAPARPGCVTAKEVRHPVTYLIFRTWYAADELDFPPR